MSLVALEPNQAATLAVPPVDHRRQKGVLILSFFFAMELTRFFNKAKALKSLLGGSI